MKVSVLSSGPTGDLTLTETPQHRILMDAGLSGRETKELLAQVGVDIKGIDMVLISHDHTDHSGGLGVLIRRYPKIPAYANLGTWNYPIESNKIGKLPVEQINAFGFGITGTFGNLDVTSFAMSHDTAQPQYYVFTSGDKRFACLTDIGYVPGTAKGKIRDVDGYLMELNYDDMMLRNDPYSWVLKYQIMFDVGHLSNDQAADTLPDVVSPKTKHIFLAHCSQHNNTQHLAHETAKDLLVVGDTNLPADVKIIDTNPMQAGSLTKI